MRRITIPTITLILTSCLALNAQPNLAHPTLNGVANEGLMYSGQQPVPESRKKKECSDPKGKGANSNPPRPSKPNPQPTPRPKG